MKPERILVALVWFMLAGGFVVWVGGGSGCLRASGAAGDSLQDIEFVGHDDLVPSPGERICYQGES